MAVDKPTTYGDYYWAMQTEAAVFFERQREQELAAVSARLMGTLHIQDFMPPELASLFDEIAAPAGAMLGDVGGRFISEVADGAVSKAASPFFEAMGYAAYNISPTKKMTPVSTATLFARKKISEEFFLERFRMGGFEPIEARFQYDSMRPYPSIPDLILYSRYHGNPDNVWGTLTEFADVDAVDFKLWEWLALQRLTTEQIHTGYRRGYLTETEALYKLSELGWSKDDSEFIKDVNWQIPNAMLMVQGGLMAEIPRTQLLAEIAFADIHPDYRETYLDAVLTKPASTDLVAYHLRKDPSLQSLDRDLLRIGIHPEFLNIYKTLAYQIPPVADIITMAVREAFTPEIAKRFGQYEGFPPDFAKYAAQKGLSQEWAERYWAAHWSLPSPQQGFEMLHRGIINETELLMLLKALDIMPFWRDKLMQMSFRRLTRVDVRRMYREGVLTEAEVYESYLELGYAETNARRMADFTVKQTLSVLSKFTSTDIVKAYTQRKIDKAETRELLRMIGTRSSDIQFILSTADYKRKWALMDERIRGIRNLYKKGINDPNKTRDLLSALEIASIQIDSYMEQWYYEIKAEERPTWTVAQTLNFAKKGTITRERAELELSIMGYDTEHRAAYLTVLV